MIRCRRYALEYNVLISFSSPLSMQLRSSLHFSFLIFIIPSVVNNMPFLALRVGITQSNISTPRAMHSRIFSGVPTPIRYRGFSIGRILQTKSVISYMSSTGSPTDNPPIAFPSLSNEAMVSADFVRRSLYVLPWTIGKRI